MCRWSPTINSNCIHFVKTGPLLVIITTDVCGSSPSRPSIKPFGWTSLWTWVDPAAWSTCLRRGLPQSHWELTGLQPRDQNGVCVCVCVREREREREKERERERKRERERVVFSQIKIVSQILIIQKLLCLTCSAACRPISERAIVSMLWYKGLHTDWNDVTLCTETII